MALHETGETPSNIPDLKKFKARIEFIGDSEEVKRLKMVLQELSP
jgi:hypothetical protein